MDRAEEIKQICLDVMSKNGIEDGLEKEMAEDIAFELVSKGYVNFDEICLDPERCVQLMANILNVFSEEKPFSIKDSGEEN